MAEVHTLVRHEWVELGWMALKSGRSFKMFRCSVCHVAKIVFPEEIK